MHNEEARAPRPMVPLIRRAAETWRGRDVDAQRCGDARAEDALMRGLMQKVCCGKRASSSRSLLPVARIHTSANLQTPGRSSGRERALCCLLRARPRVSRSPRHEFELCRKGRAGPGEGRRGGLCCRAPIRSRYAPASTATFADER